MKVVLRLLAIVIAVLALTYALIWVYLGTSLPETIWTWVDSKIEAQGGGVNQYLASDIEFAIALLVSVALSTAFVLLCLRGLRSRSRARSGRSTRGSTKAQ